MSKLSERGQIASNHEIFLICGANGFQVLLREKDVNKCKRQAEERLNHHVVTDPSVARKQEKKHLRRSVRTSSRKVLHKYQAQ